MLRQSIRMLALSMCALAVGCGVSASGTGLGAEFKSAASEAYSHIKSQLIPAIGDARFAVALGTSRAKVKLLQPKATNEAEQGVWLLLTMVNVKSAESNAGIELAALTHKSTASVEAAREVASERTQCLTEVEGWLAGNAAKLPALKRSPCLESARMAAAMLGRQVPSNTR